jgi:ubiquinol-cytochrome c reductase cytochrome b/c1 subunit
MKLMPRITLAAVAAVFLAALFASHPAPAQEHPYEPPPPPRLKWSFSGPFGTYDQAQLQRGFRVYREVCAKCHGLSLLSFRNLGEPGALGYSEAQIRQLASEYTVQDGPNDQGEMFERQGRPADRFPPPFPNENAARARYNAVPPDLSVIAKARGYERGFPWFLFDAVTQYQEQGVDYVAALLTGYEDKAPESVKILPGRRHRHAQTGGALLQPRPL